MKKFKLLTCVLIGIIISPLAVDIATVFALATDEDSVMVTRKEDSDVALQDSSKDTNQEDKKDVLVAEAKSEEPNSEEQEYLEEKKSSEIGSSIEDTEVLEDQYLRLEEIDNKNIETVLASTVNITNNPKWTSIENKIIAQENSFIPRRMSNFFVSDVQGNADIWSDRIRFSVDGSESSVIMNNVGFYMGESVSVRITFKANFIPTPTAIPYIDIFTSQTSFFELYISGGSDSGESPVDIKWEFLTNEYEPIEVGTYLKLTNLNNLKTIRFSDDTIKSLSTVSNSLVKTNLEGNDLIIGSSSTGTNINDLTTQTLVVFDVATHIEYSIIPYSQGITIGFNQNPGVQVEISDIQNIDTVKTEFNSEEDITLEWVTQQEVAFVTDGARYTDFFLDYTVPDNLIDSGLWSDTSKFEVSVKNSLNEEKNNLFTQTYQNGTVKIEANEEALRDMSFYGEIYKISLMLHVDNDVTIKKDLLNDYGLLVTNSQINRTIMNERSAEINSSTVTKNSTNFNSMVKLKMVNQFGSVIGEQTIEGILTNYVKIDIPKIANHRFESIEDDVDLNNFQFIATNQTIKVFYEEQEFTFSFSGTEGNGEATVTGYIGSDTDIKIPSEAINFEAGWTQPSPVKAVGNMALRGRNLTSVTIPEGIENIGSEGFRNNQLSSITIPTSVVSIGQNSFDNNQLTRVDIPDSVQLVEHGAFRLNPISEVTFGNGIVELGSALFEGSPLRSIEVSEEKLEDYRYLLGNSSIGLPSSYPIAFVTERTILKVSNDHYSEETLDSYELRVGERLDLYVVPRERYQVNDLSTFSWAIAQPKISWSKNGIAIDNAVEAHFMISHLQETDIGIYSASVENRALPGIEVDVILALNPEIPPIDPTDTNPINPENPNSNEGALALRFVSDLNFGEINVSDKTQTVFSKPSIDLTEQAFPNMVTIQDMRSADERDGWRLTVRQVTPIINGSVIYMTPYIHEENKDYFNINVSETMMLNTAGRDFASTDGDPDQDHPSGILSLGMHLPSAEGVRMEVPNQLGIGDFGTTIEWNLISGP